MLKLAILALALLLLCSMSIPAQEPSCTAELGSLYLQAVSFQRQLQAANQRIQALEVQLKAKDPPKE